VPSQSSAEAETPLHSGVIIDGDDVERVLLMAARGERDEEKNETTVTARRQSGLHRSRESIVCGIALVNQREKAVAQNVRCHH
jgi:hypothetical protein